MMINQDFLVIISTQSNLMEYITEGIMILNFTVYTYIGHCFCSIKVYVEDREASGGCITLNVKPSETVKDLKLRVGNLLSRLDMHLTTK